MKCVILAGGRGSRIAEETHLRPKPMIEIGGRPILWHIMKSFEAGGITEFIVCLGYRGYVIKEYFANYFLHASDATIDLERNSIEFHSNRSEPWRITLVDTGEATLTGGRVRQVGRYLDDDEPFCLAYGDGVSDIDIPGMIEFHRAQGLLATVAVVQPPARFGATTVKDDRVIRFEEKPAGSSGLVSGGWFVLSPKVLDLVEGDDTAWEREPLERLATDGQLAAWRHDGFWQPMDTLRDRELLERLWAAGNAPWKRW